ncbi:discoidin domain-containing protein [Bacteriovorax sp. PP10]|uniref:Discoidin domain-containing protein n=1 Tax=Bacteriovorax antarcticus TaxID=3088717 RepID=A0ABU5VUZ9_9BACT|nr:discoidin domain-containing protein [Bacteriovorax sp. PP10]MEA9356228.1 discoidin domain-containing protein [Bacteriovorax sp. PP10]
MGKVGLLLLTLLLGPQVFSNNALAACVNNPTNQPNSTFPALTGKLVYHSYVTYGDGTSQMFLYDFATRTLTQLSKSSWGISDPMNAHISPDGSSIVFMGIQNNSWNLYLWKLGSSALPTNLTNSNGNTRNEDPKYSFDGSSIFYKQNGDIMRMNLTTRAVVNLTKNAATIENSMPYPSVDGNTVYFAEGDNENSGIFQKNLVTGVTSPFNVEPGINNYYPIVRDANTVFFTKWISATVENDQLYTKGTAPGAVAVQLSINDCLSNNSDAAPVGSDKVIFSSTTEGGYQLYLGDLATGKRWSLTQFGINAGSTKNKLGAHYYSGTVTPPTPPTPPTPETILLSNNKPATASSSYNSSFLPALAFDGNAATRWDSIEGSAAGTQWLSVDLGVQRTINGVTLNWDAAAKAYTIQTSNDNVNWTTIHSQTNGKGGIIKITNLTGTGRYVRMYGTQRLTKWGYSLNEFQVFGY